MTSDSHVNSSAGHAFYAYRIGTGYRRKFQNCTGKRNQIKRSDYLHRENRGCGRNKEREWIFQFLQSCRHRWAEVHCRLR